MRHPSIDQVRGKGLMIGIDFVKNGTKLKPDTDLRNRVEHLAFEHGLLLLGCGKSTIRIAPPLSISKAEADEGLQIFDYVVGLAEKNA
jgi:4-aminobutyrate aminotransferase